MNMKIKWALISYMALFFIYSLSGLAESQTLSVMPHGPILPADLHEILSCLPPAPQNWKLTESEARNRFAQWQFSVASRKYLEVPPPPPQGQLPKVPGTTWITITDTGYWPEANREFLDPKSGTSGGQVKTSMDGYPAIEVEPTTEGGDEQITLWVKQRYLVYIIVSNQEKDAVKKWARQVDFKGLLQISDDGPTQISSPVAMNMIDELVPARTGSYSLLFSKPDVPTSH